MRQVGEMESRDANVAYVGLESAWYSPYLMRVRQQMIDNVPTYWCFSCGIKIVQMQMKKLLLDM